MGLLRQRLRTIHQLCPICEFSIGALSAWPPSRAWLRGCTRRLTGSVWGQERLVLVARWVGAKSGHPDRYGVAIGARPSGQNGCSGDRHWPGPVPVVSPGDQACATCVRRRVRTGSMNTVVLCVKAPRWRLGPWPGFAATRRTPRHGVLPWTRTHSTSSQASQASKTPSSS